MPACIPVEGFCLFVILANFIYKTLHAPTKIESGRYASFYVLVKNFFKCDQYSDSFRYPNSYEDILGRPH